MLAGKAPFATGSGNQEVPLELEGTDRIFVVLAEFGNKRYETATDKRFVDTAEQRLQRCRTRSRRASTARCTTRSPEPDRATDNTTIWQDDFNQAHYEDMYFNRMKEYYETQSSGRYSIDGDVTEWVKVPYNQALYGRGFCGNPPGARDDLRLDQGARP